MATDPAGTTERDHRLDGVLAAYYEAGARGEAPDPRDWLSPPPALSDALAVFFDQEERFHRLTEPLRAIEPPPPAPESLGPVRDFGDFERIAELGRGGMGVVYRARQRSLDRPVALKMIRAGDLS